MPPSPPNLDGKWAMIRAELAGEKAPDLVAQKTELELNAGTYTVRFDGQIMDQGTYELSSTAENTTMTLKGKSGPNADRIIPSLYQLAGDRLRVCYGLDSTTPTEFAAGTKTQRYLVTYRRQPGT